MHKAINDTHPKVARILLARGARVNSRSKHGVTPLMQAASSGSLEAVELLLRRNARIGLGEGHGDTALFFAVNKKTANPKVVALLLRKGARVNRRTKEGGTPLMFAATYSRGEILGLLLKNGAKVNARNKKGETALYQAVRRGREENVRVLLKWRATVHTRTREGVTALMLSNAVIRPANRGTALRPGRAADQQRHDLGRQGAEGGRPPKKVMAVSPVTGRLYFLAREFETGPWLLKPYYRRQWHFKSP